MSFREGPKVLHASMRKQAHILPGVDTWITGATDTEVVFFVVVFFSLFGWYILGVNRSVCRYKSTFTVPFSVESVDR